MVNLIGNFLGKFITTIRMVSKGTASLNKIMLVHPGTYVRRKSNDQF